MPCGCREPASALLLPERAPGTHAMAVGAGKAYDAYDFVNDCGVRNITPRVARNDARPEARISADRRLPAPAYGCRTSRGKDRDSFKTATSHRENVHCRFEIALMICPTFVAGHFLRP